MRKSRKGIAILFTILAVIGIAIGGCSMHQYQKEQEKITIATSDAAKVVYEGKIKKEDPNAFTDSAIIRSYKLQSNGRPHGYDYH